jgi:hypothetical protein
MTKAHELNLTFRWREQNGKFGREEIEIHAAYPRRHYGDLCEADQSRARMEARRLALGACSVVAFMDITGLRPSEARQAIFGRDTGVIVHRPSLNEGFDHTRLWRAADKRYAVTTEPYGVEYETTLAWCAAKGWESVLFPTGVGMWSPRGLNGRAGTRLVLMSPPKNGAPVCELAPALTVGMPCWE